MSKDALGNELEKLHALLAEQADGELTDQQRSQLQQVATDIQHALDQSHAPPEVSEKLNDLILDFESQHPTAADVLRRMVLGLSNMGI